MTMELTRDERRRIIGGSSDDPFVIHPYYTGRDKGACHDREGNLLMFFREGDAWWYIFNTLQPNDPRAKHNYRVERLSVYTDTQRYFTISRDDLALLVHHAEANVARERSHAEFIVDDEENAEYARVDEIRNRYFPEPEDD